MMKYLFRIFLFTSITAHQSQSIGEECMPPQFGTDSSSPNDITWTHCANEYGVGSPNSCSFTGLRQVRFGNGEQWVYKNTFNSLLPSECRKNNWPAAEFEWSGGPFRCEYSSMIKTQQVDMPTNCDQRHDCAGFQSAMPAGHPGFDTARVKSGGTKEPNSDIGAFRTQCELSHFAYDDPLVKPRQPGASHLHMFLGNTSINAFSNTLTLSDNGNSTCKGGTLNRTAYWAPALLDMSTKKPMIPKDSIFYYKEGYNGLSGVGFQSLPEGLGMVGRKYSWSCSEMTGEKFDHIPSCPKGARLSVTIDFPQCWDGINLWLADESHTSLTKNRTCPSTHPIPLPQISLNFRFEVEYAGQTDHLMLASDMHGNTPGTSAHADWVNGWNKDTSDTFINNCLNTQDDCHANLLGNGQMLY